MISFKALEISELSPGNFTDKIVTKTIDDIANGHILIKTQYSSLNYKDCLSISGHKGVTREYPHIPGIDCAGEVVKTKTKDFNIADKVIVTGYDLGMNHPGGFAEYLSVPGEWAVPLPDNLTLKQAMMFGTAGFTAMSAVLALQNHFSDLTRKKILITGVTGGVGSITCFLLAELGNITIASTRDIGKKYLSKLPVDQLINSKDFTIKQEKPLLAKSYDAVIDNLGGMVLENIIKSISYHGMVISCGNVVGTTFTSSVFPFILRGITLKGISSANTEMPERKRIWQKISQFKDWQALEKIITEITLDQVPEKSTQILQGQHQGRFLIGHI